jgi:hypothetical protein
MSATCSVSRAAVLAAIVVVCSLSFIHRASAQGICPRDRFNIAVGRNAGPDERTIVFDDDYDGDAVDDFNPLTNDLGNIWSSERGVTSLSWGDVDGDLRYELVVGRTEGDHARVVVYDDDRTGFAGLVEFGADWPQDRAATAVAFVNLDADPDDELIVGRNAGNGGSLERILIFDDANHMFAQLHNLGEITERPEHTWGDERSVTLIATGNVDADPGIEVAIGRDAGTDARIEIYDDASGGFARLTELGTTWSPSRRPTALLFVNVDGDPEQELIAGRSPGDGERIILYDDRAAGFAGLGDVGELTEIPQHNWGDERGVSAIAVGNVDYDEGLEFAIGRSQGGASRIEVYDDVAAGARRLIELGHEYGPLRSPTALAFVDLDADPPRELIAGRNAGDGERIVVYDDRICELRGVAEPRAADRRSSRGVGR